MANDCEFSHANYGKPNKLKFVTKIKCPILSTSDESNLVLRLNISHDQTTPNSSDFFLFKIYL